MFTTSCTISFGENAVSTIRREVLSCMLRAFPLSISCALQLVKLLERIVTAEAVAVMPPAPEANASGPLKSVSTTLSTDGPSSADSTRIAPVFLALITSLK
jgi:hypothetical protein